MAKIPTITLNSNYCMPMIGCGTYKLEDVTKLALDCGYRHFDTAYLYETEEPMGNCFSRVIEEGALKREDLFITSKLPNIGMRPSDVSRFLQKSLKDLRMDYIDLYLIHHPFGIISTSDKDFAPKDSQGLTPFDDNVDIEGIWKEMEKQVDKGLVKSIGISNFNSEQVYQLTKFARIMPAVNQVEAYLYLQQHQLNDVCKKYDIKIMAYGTLGAPYRSGGYNEVPSIFDDSVVIGMADKKKKTPAQIALRFIMQLGYPVIPKSSNENRLKENIDIFDFEFDEEEMNNLRKLDRGSDGRVLTFRVMWPGIDRSPDYPFHAPF